MRSVAFGSSPALPLTALPELKSRLNTDFEYLTGEPFGSRLTSSCYEELSGYAVRTLPRIGDSNDGAFISVRTLDTEAGGIFRGIELIAEIADRSGLFTITGSQQNDEKAQTEERFTLLHILLIFGLFQ